MYKTFTLPLKSAFALSALFILAACGGFTIDLNYDAEGDGCLASPFQTKCDDQASISAYRTSIIENCDKTPSIADTQLCRAADTWVNPPSDDENGAEVVDNTPKDIEIKPEFDKNSLTKTDKEKIETTSLEIVDFCIDPANAKNARCSPEVIDCINNPFSGSCEGDNLLGNLVRGGVTVSKAVILQDKRAVDCRDGNVDSSQCQALNAEKARCTGAVFSDASCSAVTHSVCKADAFDPLCVDNTDYDVARATACEADPSVSSDCPVAPVVDVEEEGTELEVTVNVCLSNPFDSTCVGLQYDINRTTLITTCVLAQIAGQRTAQCDAIFDEARPCLINPFDSACDANDAIGTYIGLLRSSRVEFCNSNLRVAAYCTGAPVAKSVCRFDPFDTVCIGDNDYDNSRLSACRDGSSNQHCSNIIAGVCDDNPFDPLCGNGYTGERETACRDGSASTGQCGNIVAGVCSGNPFDPLCGSGYTQSRRSLCTDNPFATRCAGEGYNDLRVSFCTRNAGNPACPTPQVTAKVWADSFDEPLSHGATAEDTESQFLIGRATDLDTGGRRPYRTRSDYKQGLNLADATFNFPRDYLGSLALGGDAADGVAFFAAEGNNDEVYNYAGILEGTNLGAPLTQTQGSAKWVGSFQAERLFPLDFVLNISFGTGDGAGEIEAVIQKLGYWYDYHLTGEFDDTGVITGTARGGIYRIHDPDNRGTTLATGKLTGLIGEEGAVGAFLVGDYFGGFVARPSSADELWQLEDKCAQHPFHRLCNVGYEAERKARVEYCIIGGNAHDTTRCGRAEEAFSINAMYYCFKHPFLSNCFHVLADHYEQAQANRVEFCRTEGNADDVLCDDEKIFARICTNHPFDAQCLGDNDYNQDRQDACTTAGTGSTECRTLAGLTCGSNPFSSYCDSGYNDARASACDANPGQQRCADTLERVCNGNPFDTLCRNTTVYLNARKTHCRSTWNDPRCPATIRAVCGVDPFDRMCNSVYDTPRETACRNGSTNTQCGGIISSICSGNPFDSLCGSGYTQNRRNACSGNPFAPRCAGNVYNDLRVTFCEDNAGTHPSCPAPTTPQVTAKVWADSFDTPLSHGASAEDTSDKFLIGKETNLDTGGLRPYSNDPNFNYGNLNLADATFNGVALGGDRADGVAFFAARADSYGFYYSYAGILSGTNLGAPLTDTTGSAKWIGSFRIEQRFATDFVLNISFGAGDEAGKIEALIQRYNFTYQDDYIIGEFNDAGVITGTVQSGRFRTNDPDNRGHVYNTGKLTGIIGEEGAVGAFLMDGLFGGFVARPTSAEELRTLEQTCTDDPFNRLCAVGYESERTARIEHCIIGGNANDTARCGFVKEWLLCIHDPFKALCNILMPEYYEQTRTNRIAFCRNADNVGNALCTVETTFAHICANHPFDALCRGDNVYRPIRRTACTDNPFAPRCAGDTYNDLRVSFCTANAGNPACPQPVVPTTTSDRVTTADWLANFDNELPSQPDEDNLESGFLEATADDLDSGTLGLSSNYRHTRIAIRMYNLNLDIATYDGKYLNGDAADGVAFFEGEPYQGAGDFAYAGILAGTDLGAPINQTGRATWHGSINETSWYTKNTDFSLDIEFNGAAGGTIKGFAASPYNGDREENYYLRLRGSFDSNGVITGTTNKGRFTDDNPDLPRPGKYSGKIAFGVLTGLIGEEGAVGAFVQGSYAGGFVVRPSAAFDSPEPLVNNARVTTADWLSSFNRDLPVVLTPVKRNGYIQPTQNEFLKASKTGLSLQNRGHTSHRTITFANAIFDGKAVGGDAADGVAISNVGAQHAGILSGTDLGAPLTQTQGSASWEGRMFVLGNFSGYVFTDFALHVNFGTGDEVGTVTGQVKTGGAGDADYQYKVDGQFDESGVITGTSEYGNFNYEDTKIPRYWRHTGTLTGLIGEEGAVGVFISSRTGYSGYVGGFIAAPSLQDYVTSGDLNDYHKWVWPTDPLHRTEVSSFLAASSTGEMNTGTLLTRDGDTPIVETLTLANATYQGRGLGGDATDGVAFFKGWKGPTDTTRSTKIHYRVYSGIFDDINLGAPVTETSGKAYWKGQFKSVHFDRVVSKDFTLKVTFYEGLGLRAAGKVDALVHDTGLKHFKVSATFNNRGVIDGSVVFGDYENNVQTESYISYKRADLLGLIGQEGALAIFKSNTPYSIGGSTRRPTTDFAGGFAVVPNLPDLPVAPAPDTTPNRVTAEDWVASFETAPAHVNDPNNHHFMQFPRRRVGGIEGIVLFADVLGFDRLNQTILTLDDDIFQDGGGDASDGIFFVRAYKKTDSDDENSYFYAGIIPETDLGAPLTQTTGTATWSGRFKASMSGGILRYVSRDFTLDITFNATGGEISTIVAGSRTVDYFEVDGTFNNRGVISGTANHVYYENGRVGDVTGDIVNSGSLRGLIGQEGAVGAFISNRQSGSTSGFAGGFVARPPSE